MGGCSPLVGRHTPLFLFANAPERNKPDRQDKNTIWFAAGKVYHPGIISLKSDQTLYIEAGAVVVGVVKANQAKHIRVCGRGVLDGSLNNHFPAGDSIAYQRFIEFRDCEDVRLEDLTLHNSTSWQVVPIHCNHVDIENLKIVSDQNSDDGMDIVRSRNVTITGCFVRTKDDCIAIKSHMDYPASEGVDHVLVQNCIFWNGGIVVRGHRMLHYVNGVLMSDVTDNDTVNRRFTGLMGVQVHVGPPMRIAYRNFRLKKLD